MRILQVSCACDPFHGGGVAQLVRRIGGQLVSQGHRVCVFTVVHDRRRPTGKVVNKNVDGFCVATLNDPVDGDFLGRYGVEDYLNPSVHEPFRRLVEEFAPDAVHFHAIQGMGAGMLNWVPEDVPTVLTMHDYWWVCPNLFLTRLDESLCSLRRADVSACEECLRPLRAINPNCSFGLDDINHRARFLGRQLQRFTRILTVSGQIRDRLAGFLPELKIEVCENGIEWSQASRDGTHKMHLGRERSGFLRFGFLGGMNRLKGFECLMRAVRRVSDPNFQVVVYGCATAWRSRIGQALPGLRRIYRSMRGSHGDDTESPADSRVVLRPHFPAGERERVFGSLDVLLVPSMVRESFSLVCREALVAGVPVIASRCGGPEEIIRHEENGLLFEPGDADGLAACMARCLNEPDLMNKLRSGANAEGIRSLSEQVDQLAEVYRTMGRRA